MLIGFLIGGFIFFTIVVYFVVLFIWPEWVGVSGRDHQKSLEEQREATGVENKVEPSSEDKNKA